MRIMGLDIGDRRTGAALSDDLGLLAHPLETIEAGDPREREDKVLDLIRRVRPDRVIVGLPWNMDGTLGPQARKALEFAASVRERSGLPVETWDERLTTVEAEGILRETQVRRGKRKKVRDTLAAVLILQGYLDHHRMPPPSG